ncbi:MAG TPA: methyltransferase domain-containing protein [Mycobacteriales bacterium]|nr:methyltransferase domain-containing protein [Mycobacteriales bacterium]
MAGSSHGAASGLAALVSRLVTEVALTDGWRVAFEQVPRHLFVPDVLWAGERNPLNRVDRTTDPQTWWELVCSDEALVTQFDDGAGGPDRPGEDWTSSSSTPSIMATMLDHLDVAEGTRVLEIGTGTGWNAALLCARLGEGNVTTVEIDPVLADQARAALHRAGFAATVITGDGEAGWPAGAPYDRVIVTAGVRRVPHAWVAQTRPGGRIVIPWRNSYASSLLCLDVAEDGSASGRFGEDVSFMWLRGQRPTEWPGRSGEESVSPLDLWPSEPVGNLAVALRLPDCYTVFRPDPDGQAYHFGVWVMHPDSGSWARIEVEPDRDIDYVYQGGPRRLWDEVEAAYAWWVEAGRPDHTRFGLTVTPDEQWTWLDEPAHRIP